MDFRVRSLGSSLLGSASFTGSASGKLRIKTENPQDLKAADRPEPRSSAGLSLGDGNAREFARIADKAVAAISDLRQQQLTLAEEASEIANPERQAELDEERKMIETEISRIQADATFQGESVLSGKTLLMDDKTVTLADLNTLAADPGVDLMTQDSAITAVNVLTESVLTARYAAAGSGAASAKASADTEPVDTEIIDVQKTRGDPVRNPSDAEKLAQGIASELRSKSGDNPTESLLAHNLNAERSKELLE